MPNFWIQCVVRTGVGWPTKDYSLKFEEHLMLLRPGTPIHSPDVICQFNSDTTSPDEGLAHIQRFLSLLSYLKKRPLRVFTSGYITTKEPPMRIGPADLFQTIDEDFEILDLPIIKHDKANLALALYREARSINSPTYRFLGFWKVICLLGKDPERAWLSKNIPRLKTPEAIQRIEEFKNNGLTIDNFIDHLYVNCRCAIAHASSSPVVNPDNPEDVKDLEKNIHLIIELAELVLEEEFGVETEESIYIRHGKERPIAGSNTLMNQALLLSYFYNQE